MSSQLDPTEAEATVEKLMLLGESCSAPDRVGCVEHVDDGTDLMPEVDAVNIVNDLKRGKKAIVKLK